MNTRDDDQDTAGRKRGLLFAAAAVGSILALLGGAAVAGAWYYPYWLVKDLGANVTPDDLQTGINVQLMGTLIGLMVAAAGMAITLYGFRALCRDLEDRFRR